MTLEDVVAEARSWKDVPYVHQGRSRYGIDCAGLPIMVARALGLVSPEFDINGYARAPDGRSLMAFCRRFMTELPMAERQPGHVLVLRWEKDPQHLGILGDYLYGGLSLIHALNRSDDKGKVVEHRLAPDFLKRSVGLFAMPGVA